MSRRIWVLKMSGWALVLVVAIQTSPVYAASTNKKTREPAKASTNVSFDELLIQGKYHFSDEAVITVEQDKLLDALLGVRKDFKDRLQQSANRQ